MTIPLPPLSGYKKVRYNAVKQLFEKIEQVADGLTQVAKPHPKQKREWVDTMERASHVLSGLCPGLYIRPLNRYVRVFTKMIEGRVWGGWDAKKYRYYRRALTALKDQVLAGILNSGLNETP